MGGGFHWLRLLLPAALLGLDSDNSGEASNRDLYDYYNRGITFTQSRSCKRNDSCHVKQKNWSVVRRLAGYDRYSSRTALDELNRLYDLLRLCVDFFQPVKKPVAKTRDGSKVHNVYLVTLQEQLTSDCLRLVYSHRQATASGRNAP